VNGVPAELLHVTVRSRPSAGSSQRFSVIARLAWAIHHEWKNVCRVRGLDGPVQPGHDGKGHRSQRTAPARKERSAQRTALAVKERCAQRTALAGKERCAQRTACRIDT
jgi:hypothetical protein